MMNAANSFAVARDRAEQLGCRKLHDNEVAQLVSIATKLEQYLQDPVTHHELEQCLLQLAARCNGAQLKLRKSANSLQYRQRQKHIEKEDGSVSIFLAVSQSFSLCLNLSRSCSAVTLDLSCVAGWYLGKIIAYDAPSSKHTISWLQDDDKDSLVDLMACKMCTEWRFVQSDEDIVAQMKELNGDDGDNGALTVVWHSD